MEEGAYVWCRDTAGDEAWIFCEVLQKAADQLKLKQKDKPDVVFTKGIEAVNEETGERKFEDVELANTPLSEQEKYEGIDNDLIALPHLHEPAILHSLSDRFFRGKIYTWTGPVLIAVNPFQRLQLYTNDILEQYRRDGLLKAQGIQSGKELEPHVFAIADRSYRQMMREQRRSQSILISGESGAGKTESTKIVMLYLTTLGAGNTEEEKEEDQQLSVMQRVLQSNPVLEAFGNARTLRNDNSSRFGKFIELGFSRSGHLMGAKVQTYLLEKVRLAFHAPGERNYHIFYQLLRGCSEEDHHKYEFHEGLTGGLDLPNYFHYTGQGGAPHLREFTDESGLEYTLKAMRKLGWSEDTIDGVLKLVAGLLHLGQIKFNSIEKDGLECGEVADEKILDYSSRLLGVDTDKLRVALTERIIIARGQEIRTNLTPEKAADARDALAKTIYGSLFLWVVDQVNASIGWTNDSDIRSSCGVLDIFGFECFAVNSFEQLCINYTNEALQQQFNQFIFKLEQQEYESENIEWAFIEFPDNQDCLDTIQAPKTGILAMLDDECRLPKGSDRNFAKRMFEQYLPGKQTVSDNTRFHATNVQKAKSIFCVRHFAGLVEYSAETSFMEKNKDEIPITAQNMFETAISKLIKDSYAVQKRENLGREVAESSSGKQAKQKTVGQQFKEQLSSLIESVQKTDPHYIRCIKPNDAAKPLLMTRKRTTEQLRYGGVLEAVRVARAGYPVRLKHEAFFTRYRLILPTIPDEVLPRNLDGENAQQHCVKLVEVALEEGAKHTAATASGPLDPKEAGISRSEKIRRMINQPIPMKFPRPDVQLGKTKVFMRKHPHDCLEAHRVFNQNASVIVIQTWARGLAQQRRFYITQDAIETIQRCWRGAKGRERWTRLRKGAAGDLLTKVFRMLVYKRRFSRAKRGSIQFQAITRGRNVRRAQAETMVSRCYRRYAARKKFLMLKSAAVALQCKKRVIDSRKAFDELKKEQKDVGKLKNMNTKLKEEMVTLRAMLSAQAKESAASDKHKKELEEKEARIAELEKKIAEIEKQLDEARHKVEKLESDLKASQDESAKDKEQIMELQKSGPKRGGSGLDTSGHHRRGSSGPPPEGVPTDYVSPEKLAEHRARVARLEDRLETEKRLRREADSEIIRLRAEMNGVELNDDDVKALMKQESMVSESAASSITDSERNGLPPEIAGIDNLEEDQGLFHFGNFKVGKDFLPRIRRGRERSEEKEEEMAVGWKYEIRNRREREEYLRDEVHKFESKLGKSAHALEEGVDVVMWQFNKTSPDVAGGEETDEFALKSSQVNLKIHKRGDLWVQAVLTFALRQGYLSKAMGRHKNVDKTALEPLSLHDILEVHAGCSGYDHTQLPTASGKTKSKKKESKGENKQVSHFLTIKATPTPLASSRSYIFRFKSRVARNEALIGLRSILADMQINEGVSISGLHHSREDEISHVSQDEIMIPLSAVHEAINRERESYDRILLMLLQGNEDLKQKEDELLGLHDKLESVMDESKQKDKTQTADSKLIMQLSKKLEGLLMDNEDLRDSNERLSTRLVEVEMAHRGA